MGRDRFFCASASRANQESIYGTVARIRSWLLLEYHSAWRRHAVEDSHILSRPVKEHLRRLEQQGVIDRSLLIRREHIRSGPIECFFVNSCEPAPAISRILLSDYDELAAPRTSAEPVGGLMYAICTHGRHDKCCAKFGIPVYCAFRDLLGERAWQCSHVGGDRFAANVVVFPYGIYYGRLAPEDVPELIRRSERGDVWLPYYRGRSCVPRAVQVAEYFARAESGRMAIDEFRPIVTGRRDDGITEVRFQARSDASVHVVEYIKDESALNAFLTCNSAGPSPVPQYRLIRYGRQR